MVSLFCFISSSCTRTLVIRNNLAGLRRTWQSDSTSNFVLYYPKNSFPDSNKNYLEHSIEKYRSDILQLLHEKDYTNTIDAFFFSTKKEMNLALKTNAEGVSYPKNNVCAFVYGRNFNGYTRHELSHVISINLWGRSATWIEEGFATLTDESFQTMDFHKQAKKILTTKDFIPLDELFKNFNKFNGWYRYAEAASLVKFILENHGIESFRSVWKNKALRFNNKPENELSKEWLLMLDSI